MNKEEIINNLKELNRQINFEELDNNIKNKKIEDIEKERQSVIEKIAELENNINSKDHYEKYANEYKKRYETMYNNAKLMLIKKNDDIARINESIEILTQESNNISNIINECNIEINKIQNSNNISSLDKSKLEINKRRIINLKNALENNNRMIQYNNDLLNNNVNDIDALNKNIENQTQNLKNFNDNLKKEIIEIKKEKEQKALNSAKKFNVGLTKYKQTLEADFKNQLEKMINDLENDNLTTNEAIQEINLFKNRLFEKYLEKDDETRKDELNKNLNEQKKYKELINELEVKLSNKANYKLKDSTRSNMMNNIKKIERLTSQGKYLFYEGYRKDYEDITKMYEEDKNNLLSELNENISNERRNEINSKINELNITIAQGKELTNDYSKYKNLFDKIKERSNSQEIDMSSIRLDENKLSNYTSIINSLKNRQIFLESNVKDILNKFNINNLEKQKKDTDEIENNTENLEIVSVKRPLKEKMKRKMKKISVAIITSMTMMLSANSIVNLNNNIDDNTNNKVIETIIDENSNPNITGEEAIEKVENELKNEITKNLSIEDQITIKENSNIYKNQIDASNKTNPYNPLYSLNNSKNIIGISIQMPDGTFKFVQDDNSLQKFKDQGGVISACLTGENDKPEGFFNINDISKINKLEHEIGGMSR